jgi:hypothetical protein
MLVRINPLPDVEAIAIDGQRSSLHSVRDENGDELFGKLKRTIVV